MNKKAKTKTKMSTVELAKAVRNFIQNKEDTKVAKDQIKKEKELNKNLEKNKWNSTTTW